MGTGRAQCSLDLEAGRRGDARLQPAACTFPEPRSRCLALVWALPSKPPVKHSLRSLEVVTVLLCKTEVMADADCN